MVKVAFQITGQGGLVNKWIEAPGENLEKIIN